MLNDPSAHTLGALGYCGPGACDPFMRHDANALYALRYSTGRIIASLDPLTPGLRVVRRSEIELFNYGVGEQTPDSTGYVKDGYGSFDADETMTNCARGGAMAPSGQAFVIVGMAVRVGTPYLCGLPSHGSPALYPSWLDEVSEKIRSVLSEDCTAELAFGTMAMRYRLGSLVTHGAVFDFATGVGEPPPEVEKPCGQTLKHSGRVFATCALQAEHTEEQHCGGTILWTDEDAAQIESGREQPMFHPKTFSPFALMAISGYEDRAVVRIRTGRDDLVFEAKPAVGRVAVPIRVWLFGRQIFVPDPITCGVPILTDEEVMVMKHAIGKLDPILGTPPESWPKSVDEGDE